MRMSFPPPSIPTVAAAVNGACQSAPALRDLVFAATGTTDLDRPAPSARADGFPARLEAAERRLLDHAGQGLQGGSENGLAPIDAGPNNPLAQQLKRSIGDSRSQALGGDLAVVKTGSGPASLQRARIDANTSGP